MASYLRCNSNVVFAKGWTTHANVYAAISNITTVGASTFISTIDKSRYVLSEPTWNTGCVRNIRERLSVHARLILATTVNGPIKRGRNFVL